MGRKPAKVRGLKWREDRGTWEARYDVNGKRVRKSFTDRSEAIVWIEMARGLKHKEGLGSLPTSAIEPLLTVAERKAMREKQVNSVTLGRLCKQYLAHIQNPYRYKSTLSAIFTYVKEREQVLTNPGHKIRNAAHGPDDR